MDSVLYKPRNEGIQIQLRRYRDVLALNGGMVIALSLWDVIKVFIGFFLGEETIAKIIGNIMSQMDESVINPKYENVVNIIMWAVFLLVILLFSMALFLYHLYIGLNAFRAGRQTAKKKRSFYLVLTLLSALFAVFFMISNAYSLIKGVDVSGNVDFAYFVMETTAAINYVSILYAAYKIRKLEDAGSKKR